MSEAFHNPFGTDPRKLVRTNAPDTSIEAAASVDTPALEWIVYKAIRSYGQHGCISDQLLTMFNTYPYSSITARYRALLDKNYIEDTGERRPGKSGRNQRVMRAINREVK
jgi:hypothetical protein